MPQVEKSRNDKLKVTRRDQVKVTHPITTAVYTQLLMTLCIARWKRTELTATQRQEVERLGSQLAALREATQSVLSIADELKDSTIEKVLAKSDLELGLDSLLGRRKL